MFPLHSWKFITAHTISPTLIAIATFSNRSMATSTSSKKTNLTSTSTDSPCAFTTLAQTITTSQLIKKSKFIAIAGHVSDQSSAQKFLAEVRDPRATHNCWAFKVGGLYRSSDDGEPSGTGGRPIQSAIDSSGIDRVMVVVIRHFGGIKLGTAGLGRAYGGLASECLKNAPTIFVKTQLSMGVEVPFDLIGALYRQLRSFEAKDIKQDCDTGKDGFTMVTFKIDFDKAESLEDAIKTRCARELVFYK